MKIVVCVKQVPDTTDKDKSSDRNPDKRRSTFHIKP